MGTTALAEAYETSVLEIAWHGAWLVVRPRPVGEIVGAFPTDVRTLHVVTGHNPESRELTADENDVRNRMLRADLDARGWARHDAVGRSPDGAWSEASFAVVDVDRDDVLDLAARYQQHAIFEWTPRHLAVVWCRPDLPTAVHGWTVERAR